MFPVCLGGRPGFFVCVGGSSVRKNNRKREFSVLHFCFRLSRFLWARTRGLTNNHTCVAARVLPLLGVFCFFQCQDSATS